MDIKINNENSNFKFRVGGLLIHDNKVLVVKIMNNDFYCLPGGHVEMGEDANHSIIREIHEETGIDCTVQKFLAIVENFFTRKNGALVHELSFIYKLNLNKEILLNDWINYETDKDCVKKLEFKWIDLNELSMYDVRPNIIKELIKNDEFKHYIVRNDDILEISN